jgi:hypothetical protein
MEKTDVMWRFQVLERPFWGNGNGFDAFEGMVVWVYK